MTEMKWEQITAHLVARYPGAKSTATSLSFDWQSHRIVALPSEVAGIPCLTLVGWIGADTALDAREALGVNGRLLGGAVIRRGRVYLFRLSMPLAVLTAAQLDAIVDLVGSEAAALRKTSRVAEVDAEGFCWAV